MSSAIRMTTSAKVSFKSARAGTSPESIFRRTLCGLTGVRNRLIVSRFMDLIFWVTGIAYRRGYYGFPNHSAICSPHILTSQAHICNVTMRFSCAGSRPVGLPAEYQSLFTAGVAPRLGEYAGAITSITACWIATARHLLPGANTQSPQAE